MSKKNIDRRQKDAVAIANVAMPLMDRFSQHLAGFQLSDILTTNNHSEDFIDTRADYILYRLKLMMIVFAILVPLSVVVDVIFLEEHLVGELFLARVSLSIALLFIAALCRKNNTKLIMHYLLPLGFILPVLFYVANQLILRDNNQDVDAVGYSYMPYLIVTMLALFPLTVRHGMIIIVMIFLPCFLLELYFGQVFSLSAFNKFWAFSMFAVIGLWLQSGQLVMLLKLYRESTMDPLTGLINRRVLMKRLEKELRQGHEFYVLIFDLDRFKKINDTYGHLDGDLVLKTIATVIKREIRHKDIVARFGGEEFVAIVTGLKRSEVLKIADRIRKACENEVIINKEGTRINVTTSIGVTQHILTEDLALTFSRADEMLYQAKHEGRNCVIADWEQNKQSAQVK